MHIGTSQTPSDPPSLREEVTTVTGLSATLAMAALIITAVFGALDRQILLLLGEPMRLALKMSDTAFGVLQGAGITLFAGVASIPICWLADRHGRRPVLACCVLVWAAGTAACGIAQNYVTMFVSAMAIGIGEAGITPIIFGLIPGVVPQRHRVLANATYAMALLLGTGLGAWLSGLIVEHIDGLRHLLPLALRHEASWRLALLAVSLPGLPIAITVLLIREQKQSPDGAASSPSGMSMPNYIRRHGRLMFYVFGGVGLGQLGLMAMTAWVPIAAMRNLGATAAQVGAGIGAAYIAASLIGALIGGVGTRVMRPAWGINTPIRVIVVGFTVGTLAAFCLPTVTAAWHMYLIVGVQIAAIVAGSVLAPTLLQDMTPAASRSSTIATGNLLAHFLTSLGPVLVGLLSDHGFSGPSGLLMASTLVSAGGLVLGALLLLLCTGPLLRAVREFHPHLLTQTPSSGVMHD